MLLDAAVDIGRATRVQRAVGTLDHINEPTRRHLGDLPRHFSSRDLCNQASSRRARGEQRRITAVYAMR
jgi:hypothetical protein